MKYFAVLNNDNIVENTIVAEFKDIAESVVNKPCIEYTLDDPVGIGYVWSNEYNKLIPPQPYASWTFDGSKWICPEPYPNDGDAYMWDEDSMSWIKK